MTLSFAFIVFLFAFNVGTGGCTGAAGLDAVDASAAGASGALTTTSTCANCLVVVSVKVKTYFPTGKFCIMCGVPDPRKGTSVVAPAPVVIA